MNYPVSSEIGTQGVERAGRIVRGRLRKERPQRHPQSGWLAIRWDWGSEEGDSIYDYWPVEKEMMEGNGSHTVQTVLLLSCRRLAS